MNKFLNQYFKIIRNANKFDKRIIIAIIFIFLIIIALNLHLVFKMLSNQTEEIGQMQLEKIRSDLQQTLTSAENTTERIAIESEQLLNNNLERQNLDNYFQRQCKVQADIFKGACLEVYIAGQDWAIIPGFDIPENYHPPERLWYKELSKIPAEFLFQNLIYFRGKFINISNGIL